MSITDTIKSVFTGTDETKPSRVDSAGDVYLAAVRSVEEKHGPIPDNLEGMLGFLTQALAGELEAFEAAVANTPDLESIEESLEEPVARVRALLAEKAKAGAARAAAARVLDEIARGEVAGGARRDADMTAQQKAKRSAEDSLEIVEARLVPAVDALRTALAKADAKRVALLETWGRECAARRHAVSEVVSLMGRLERGKATLQNRMALALLNGPEGAIERAKRFTADVLADVGLPENAAK
jgi:hypothetical protein